MQVNVIELRSREWSFPAIANHLGISVGSAWNIVKVMCSVSLMSKRTAKVHNQVSEKHDLS